MNLNENIITLRKQKKLSQGDLADAMQVSRQSVSKWETGQSVPDLDKLVRMAQLFGVTLDELVGSTTMPSLEPVPAPAAAQTFPLQKILGLIFLGVGLLCGALAFLLGPVLLLPGGWLLLCGLICLLVKRHAALWIGWITLLPLLLWGSYFTGLSTTALFHRFFYITLVQHVSIDHVLVLLLWACLAALVWATVRAIRNRH